MKPDQAKPDIWDINDGTEKNFEQYPLQKEFDAFCEEAKTLDASHEEGMEDGRGKEYISTAALYRTYEKVFGNAKLVKSAVDYRIRQALEKNEFPNDLMVIEDAGAGAREPKYFVNRLNKNLLEAIFSPAYIERDFSKLVDNVKDLEEGLLSQQELKGGLHEEN